VSALASQAGHGSDHRPVAMSAMQRLAPPQEPIASGQRNKPMPLKSADPGWKQARSRCHGKGLFYIIFIT
jgi:hypothetical protein